ncbi:hypothetical protein FB45DRAFT_1009033 [Roridomyces roridus]|uniref:Uncharacterized protein n=1 Tax=Roridomyces roridus TaxID=1738132 RepID=A0AAD7B7D3_9AGAR|nr:hypothetical protein FB45DRAFT_1009033 [Roridomyces roridus]
MCGILHESTDRATRPRVLKHVLDPVELQLAPVPSPWILARVPVRYTCLRRLRPAHRPRPHQRPQPARHTRPTRSRLRLRLRLLSPAPGSAVAIVLDFANAVKLGMDEDGDGDERGQDLQWEGFVHGAGTGTEMANGNRWMRRPACMQQTAVRSRAVCERGRPRALSDERAGSEAGAFEGRRASGHDRATVGWIWLASSQERRLRGSRRVPMGETPRTRPSEPRLLDGWNGVVSWVKSQLCGMGVAPNPRGGVAECIWVVLEEIPAVWSG